MSGTISCPNPLNPTPFAPGVDSIFVVVLVAWNHQACTCPRWTIASVARTPPPRTALHSAVRRAVHFTASQTNRPGWYHNSPGLTSHEKIDEEAPRSRPDLAHVQALHGMDALPSMVLWGPIALTRQVLDRS
jgi:hypothetical protein